MSSARNSSSITVTCPFADPGKPNISYTVFPSTLISQVLESSCSHFGLDPKADIGLLTGGVFAVPSLTCSDYHICSSRDKASSQVVLELARPSQEPLIELVLQDQFGRTERLADVHFYQPLVDVARRLEGCLVSKQELGQQLQLRPPEVDLFHAETALSLSSSPAASKLKDGDVLFCYRYGEACQRHKDLHWQQLQGSEQCDEGGMGAATDADQQEDGEEEEEEEEDEDDDDGRGSFVALYLSDWLCSYQRRFMMHHDLSVPWEVLLLPFCNWRGIKPSEASFMWLQFYRQIHISQTGDNEDIEDGDSVYAYLKDDPQGRLWDAVFSGDVARVAETLDAGASAALGPPGLLESRMGGRYPLHAAAANNHVEVARLLSERGANVNQLDAAAEPALWHAIEHNHYEMVKLLVSLGATACDLMPSQSYSSEESEEEDSAESRSAAAAATSVQDLTDGKSSKAVEPKAPESALAAPSHRPPLDSMEYAALPHATSRGHLEIVQLLLQPGRCASPYALDEEGLCAFDHAIDRAGCSGRALALLSALLEADSAFAPTQRLQQQNYVRYCQALKRSQRYPQALGCSCRLCNAVVEIRASETEATRSLRDQVGCVALVRAVQAGGPRCLEVMQLLHKHGALLDAQDADGRTALHQAVRYSRLAEAKWLIEAGAHVDVSDFEGLLPLHQAACSGQLQFSKLLVEGGSAPINLHTVRYITQEALESQVKKHESLFGVSSAAAPASSTSSSASSALSSKKVQTASAAAARRKQQQQQQVLDVSGLTTIGGNSALALAARHGHADIVEYLMQQGALFDLKNAADSSAFHAALDRGAATIANLLLKRANNAGKKSSASLTHACALPITSGAGGNSSTLKLKGSTVKPEKEIMISAAERRKAARASAKLEAAALAQIGKAAKASKAAGAGDGAEGGHLGGRKSGGIASVAQVSPPEPALAVDAGAGLREMVAAERLRLRQQLGLSKPTPAPAAVPTPTPVPPATTTQAHAATSATAPKPGQAETGSTQAASTGSGAQDRSDSGADMKMPRETVAAVAAAATTSGVSTAPSAAASTPASSLPQAKGSSEAHGGKEAAQKAANCPAAAANDPPSGDKLGHECSGASLQAAGDSQSGAACSEPTASVAVAASSGSHVRPALSPSTSSPHPSGPDTAAASNENGSSSKQRELKQETGTQASTMNGNPRDIVPASNSCSQSAAQAKAASQAPGLGADSGRGGEGTVRVGSQAALGVASAAEGVKGSKVPTKAGGSGSETSASASAQQVAVPQADEATAAATNRSGAAAAAARTTTGGSGGGGSTTPPTTAAGNKKGGNNTSKAPAHVAAYVSVVPSTSPALPNPSSKGVQVLFRKSLATPASPSPPPTKATETPSKVPTPAASTAAAIAAPKPLSGGIQILRRSVPTPPPPPPLETRQSGGGVKTSNGNVGHSVVGTGGGVAAAAAGGTIEHLQGGSSSGSVGFPLPPPSPLASMFRQVLAPPAPPAAASISKGKKQNGKKGSQTMSFHALAHYQAAPVSGLVPLPAVALAGAHTALGGAVPDPHARAHPSPGDGATPPAAWSNFTHSMRAAAGTLPSKATAATAGPVGAKQHTAVASSQLPVALQPPPPPPRPQRWPQTGSDSGTPAVLPGLQPPPPPPRVSAASSDSVEPATGMQEAGETRVPTPPPSSGAYPSLPSSHLQDASCPPPPRTATFNSKITEPWLGTAAVAHPQAVPTAPNPGVFMEGQIDSLHLESLVMTVFGDEDAPKGAKRGAPRGAREPGGRRTIPSSGNLHANAGLPDLLPNSLSAAPGPALRDPPQSLGPAPQLPPASATPFSSTAANASSATSLQGSCTSFPLRTSSKDLQLEDIGRTWSGRLLGDSSLDACGGQLGGHMDMGTKLGGLMGPLGSSKLGSSSGGLMDRGSAGQKLGGVSDIGDSLLGNSGGLMDMGTQLGRLMDMSGSKLGSSGGLKDFKAGTKLDSSDSLVSLPQSSLSLLQDIWEGSAHRHHDSLASQDSASAAADPSTCASSARGTWALGGRPMESASQQLQQQQQAPSNHQVWPSGWWLGPDVGAPTQGGTLDSTQQPSGAIPSAVFSYPAAKKDGLAAAASAASFSGSPNQGVAAAPAASEAAVTGGGVIGGGNGVSPGSVHQSPSDQLRLRHDAPSFQVSDSDFDFSHSQMASKFTSMSSIGDDDVPSAASTLHNSALIELLEKKQHAAADRQLKGTGSQQQQRRRLLSHADLHLPTSLFDEDESVMGYGDDGDDGDCSSGEELSSVASVCSSVGGTNPAGGLHTQRSNTPSLGTKGRNRRGHSGSGNTRFGAAPHGAPNGGGRGGRVQQGSWIALDSNGAGRIMFPSMGPSPGGGLHGGPPPSGMPPPPPPPVTPLPQHHGMGIPPGAFMGMPSQPPPPPWGGAQHTGNMQYMPGQMPGFMPHGGGFHMMHPPQPPPTAFHSPLPGMHQPPQFWNPPVELYTWPGQGLPPRPVDGGKGGGVGRGGKHR